MLLSCAPAEKDLSPESSVYSALLLLCRSPDRKLDLVDTTLRAGRLRPFSLDDAFNLSRMRGTCDWPCCLVFRWALLWWVLLPEPILF